MAFLALLLPILARSQSIKVYESTLPLRDEDSLSGLRLKTKDTNIDIADLSGISICAVFNFKRLLLTSSKLMTIQSPDQVWSLFNFMIGYEFSFFNFGNSDAFGSSTSWIMRLQFKETFIMWSTNRWHHICVSYTKSTSHISLIMVSNSIFKM